MFISIKIHLGDCKYLDKWKYKGTMKVCLIVVSV